MGGPGVPIPAKSNSLVVVLDFGGFRKVLSHNSYGVRVNQHWIDNVIP